MKATIINIVIELEEGVPQQPVCFEEEYHAGRYFENKVTDPTVRFRKKKDRETWEQYRQAFSGYTYSDNVKYDILNWEIHWFRTTCERDEQLITADFHNVIDPFDRVEIHPCKRVDLDHVERCYPNEAGMWSVYIYYTSGISDCVADFETEEKAHKFRKFLRSYWRYCNYKHIK